MRLFSAACLLIVAVPIGCGPGTPPIETISGQTMGTVYAIRAVVSPDQPNQLLALQDEIDAALVEINRQMSTYDPRSELSAVNQAPAGQWVTVSAELVQLLETARQISDQTQGAFDVTVGPVVNLWHFGPDKERKEFPTDEEIAAALKLVGYQQLETQVDPPAVRKPHDATYVDLSAIAKGYGVDEICRLLEEHGLRQYMVEIGGEVRTAGRKPNGQPWNIAIETPSDEGRRIETIVGLTDQALATSGDYRNFFLHEGRRYSHTIDPQTGRPVEHDLASVSVLHAQCALADAYATALLVLGPDQGYNLAQEQGLAAYFQTRAADGSTSARATDAWQQYVSAQN